MKRTACSLMAMLVAAACGGRALDYDDPANGRDGGTPQPDAGRAADAAIRTLDGSVTSFDSGTVRKDASRIDDPPDPDECTPGDVGSFVPTWKPPSPAHSGKCTTAQAEAMLCLLDSNADFDACDALVNDPANQDCIECIYTPSTAAKLGPVVITGNFASLNQAGCVANVTGNATATGCAAKMQAAEACADESCASCVIDEFDDESFEKRAECNEEASTTVCSTFTNAASCADTLLGLGGTAAACADGVEFYDRAVTYAKIFCAP